MDEEKFGGQITEPELRQWARNRSLYYHTHGFSLAGCSSFAGLGYFGGADSRYR